MCRLNRKPLKARRPQHSLRLTLRLSPEPTTPPTASSELLDTISDNFHLILCESTLPLSVIPVYARTLCHVGEVGRGCFGTVDLVREPLTGLYMAVKKIRDIPNELTNDYRYLDREVRACLGSTRCPYLVRCYGVMRLEGDIWICMELMDSSLYKVYCKAFEIGLQVPESFLGKTAHSVILGLCYLKKVLHLLHRDVKPSNMLVNRGGEIKLCDYGISGVVDSYAASKTIQAGCKPYMAPERVDFLHPACSKYDERSDVWSLGISLMEIALGCHPYDRWETPFEQMKQLLDQPPPTLPQNSGYSQNFHDFIEICLTKNYQQRPKYGAVMETGFIKWYQEKSKMENARVNKEILGFIEQVLDVPVEKENCRLNH